MTNSCTVGQFALAQGGLLDEELDVGLLLLLADALVGIGGNGSLRRVQGLPIEFGGGDNAFCHLHLRYLHRLLADTGIEGQIHIGLVVVGIGEVGFHRVVATQTVGDGLVVAQYALTLEGGGIALDGLTIGIAQFRDDGHHSLLVHVLLREVAVDCGWYSACLSL